MTIKRFPKVFLTLLLGVLATIYFFQTTWGAAARADRDPNGFAVLTARVQEGVRPRILTSATTAFAPSLEMKENAGFLLTPALLVQEIISEDVVVTYPGE